jgi:hypothetical protein
MAFDRAAAKAAGYSDQEIEEYLSQKKAKPDMTSADAPPPPPPATEGTAEQPGFDFGEMATTMAAGAVPYAGPAAAAAAAGGAGYGLYKFGKGVLETGKDVAQAMRERTAFEASREARIAKRAGFSGTPGSAPVTGPAAPAQPAAQVQLSPQAQALRTPPAPAQPATGMGPPRGSVSVPANFGQSVQQMAYDKLASMANAARTMAPAARAAGGMMSLLTPSNVGQQYPFPTKGPMAGREINPGTGRPWTKQELEAYNVQQGMR